MEPPATLPPEQPAPEQPAPAATVRSPEYKKAQKRLIVMIVLVASALPAAIIISVVSRVVLNSVDGSSSFDQPSGADAVQAITNIIVLLLGMFSILGWIPVVIMAVRLGKKK